MATGHKVKPEAFVDKSFKSRDFVNAASNWQAVLSMAVELQGKFEKDTMLPLDIISRLADVVRGEPLTPAAKTQIVRSLDELAVFSRPAVPRLRSSRTLAALEALVALQTALAPSPTAAAAKKLRGQAPAPLGATSPAVRRLVADLTAVLQAGVHKWDVNETLKALGAIATLGGRASQECLEEVFEVTSRRMRYCTPEAVGAAATGLAVYTNLPVDKNWLARLCGESQRAFGFMSGEQLVDLVTVFARKRFTLSEQWANEFMPEMMARLPGMTSPSTFSRLLYALVLGGMAVSEAFLQAVLKRMAEPLVKTPTAKSRAASASSETILSCLSAEGLAVVANVLSIYSYAPGPGLGPEWVATYIDAIEARAGEFKPREVVSILDACSELGLGLGADCMDELLAVSEEGLGDESLGAPQCVALVVVLTNLGHIPDEFWAGAFVDAVVAKVSTAPDVQAIADLANALAGIDALMNGEVAMAEDEQGQQGQQSPGDAPGIPDADKRLDAFLKAAKARVTQLGGGEATAREALWQALPGLMGLTQQDAAAWYTSLPPPAPPPKPAADAAGADDVVYDGSEDDSQAEAEAVDTAATAAAAVSKPWSSRAALAAAEAEAAAAAAAAAACEEEPKKKRGGGRRKKAEPASASATDAPSMESDYDDLDAEPAAAKPKRTRKTAAAATSASSTTASKSSAAAAAAAAAATLAAEEAPPARAAAAAKKMVAAAPAAAPAAAGALSSSSFAGSGSDSAMDDEDTGLVASTRARRRR